MVRILVVLYQMSTSMSVLLYSGVQIQGTFVLRSTTSEYFCTPGYNFRVLLYSGVHLEYFCTPEYCRVILLHSKVQTSVVLCALCSSALFVICALCTVHCALCTMLYALCSMLYALYGIQYGLRIVLTSSCSLNDNFILIIYIKV